MGIIRIIFSCILLIISQELNAAEAVKTLENIIPRVLTNKKPPPATKRTIINVAIILPLKGDNKKVGETLLGSLVTIKKLVENPKNDVLFGSDFKFVFHIKSEECTVSNAQKIAHDIVAARNIMFVIGHFCSKASLVAAPIYNDAGIIQITPFSSEITLTEKGYKSFFRLTGRNDRFGEVTSRWLHRLRQSNKLATVYGDDTYGRALVKNIIINLEFSARGTNNKFLKDSFYKNAIDYTRFEENVDYLAAQLIRNNVKLIYYAGYYKKLAALVKAVKKRDPDVLFVASDSVQSHDFWDKSNGYADGVMFTHVQDITRDISEKDKNAIKRRVEFNKIKQDSGLEAAIREYGIQNSRSFFPSNRTYKNRVDFIKAYFAENNRFPNLYMSHLYAALEIIKSIVIDDEFSPIFKEQEKVLKSTNDIKIIGSDIARFMKEKGFYGGDENVGFSTILGAVNFTELGDWQNAKYVIYKWVNKPQRRDWLSEDPNDLGKFVGLNGDYVRLISND